MHKLARISAALAVLALTLSAQAGAAFAATDPSWTQANSGDPGITIVSLPSFTTETLTYRQGGSYTAGAWGRFAIPR